MYNMCVGSVYEIWLYGYQFRLNDQGDYTPFTGPYTQQFLGRRLEGDGDEEGNDDSGSARDRASARESEQDRRLHTGTMQRVRITEFEGNGVDGYDINGGLHPYHQHVNAYQVVGIREDDVPVDFIRVGEYRDVVGQLVNGTIIRFQPHLFDGPVSVTHPHPRVLVLVPVGVCACNCVRRSAWSTATTLNTRT